jgi:hypothetical protein
MLTMAPFSWLISGALLNVFREAVVSPLHVDNPHTVTQEAVRNPGSAYVE